MSYSDSDIIFLLNADEEKAISLLFDNYYDYLCNVVYRVIHDRDYAEDIVQEIFFEVWKKRDSIKIDTSLRGYLRRAAVNRSLNHLRKKKMQFAEDEEAVLRVPAKSIDGQAELERSELENRIHAAIDTLPPKCKIVFGLSRFENMSYQEIANSLDISVKTVENQISKALRILRSSLDHYVTK